MTAPGSSTLSLRRRFVHTLVRSWRDGRAERATRRARRTAMRRFAALHPYWYASWFDEALLRRVPSDALALRDPERLSREWTRQFRYRDERRREADVRQLVPVAQSFFELLAAAEAEEAAAPTRAAPTDVAGGRGATDGTCA